MTDQELKDLVASLAIQSAKTDAKLEKLFTETDAKLERLGILAGNTAKNIGYVTEDYFYGSTGNFVKSVFLRDEIKYSRSFRKDIITSSRWLEIR
jgi:hypothetical protein